MSLTPQEKQKILQHIEFWENAKGILKVIFATFGFIFLVLGFVLIGYGIGIQNGIIVIVAYIIMLCGSALFLSSINLDAVLIK